MKKEDKYNQKFEVVESENLSVKGVVVPKSKVIEFKNDISALYQRAFTGVQKTIEKHMLSSYSTEFNDKFITIRINKKGKEVREPLYKEIIEFLVERNDEFINMIDAEKFVTWRHVRNTFAHSTDIDNNISRKQIPDLENMIKFIKDKDLIEESEITGLKKDFDKLVGRLTGSNLSIRLTNHNKDIKYDINNFLVDGILDIDKVIQTDDFNLYQSAVNKYPLTNTAKLINEMKQYSKRQLFEFAVDHGDDQMIEAIRHNKDCDAHLSKYKSTNGAGINQKYFDTIGLNGEPSKEFRPYVPFKKAITMSDKRFLEYWAQKIATQSDLNDALNFINDNYSEDYVSIKILLDAGASTGNKIFDNGIKNTINSILKGHQLENMRSNFKKTINEAKTEEKRLRNEEEERRQYEWDD